MMTDFIPYTEEERLARKKDLLKKEGEFSKKPPKSKKFISRPAGRLSKEIRRHKSIYHLGHKAKGSFGSSKR